MAFRLAPCETCFSIFFFAIVVAGAFHDESEQPWYESLASLPFPHYYATDLDAANIDLPLQNFTAETMLVEFYAPWCPHCQHFAPEVERLALAAQRLNGGASLAVATVDCVKFAASCVAYGVDSFPTLMWGRRSDWLAGANASRHHGRGITRIMPERNTAESVASLLGSRAHLLVDVSRVSRADPLRLDQAHGWSVSASASSAADPWDAQVAAALLLHNALAQHTYTNTTRGIFEGRLQSFVGFLSQRFPDTRCRASLLVLQERLQSNWVSLEETSTGFMFSELEVSEVQHRLSSDKLEQTWRLCGTSWADYGQGWHGCRGSWPGKRGYTCGIWTLFHSIAARSSDDTAFHDLERIRAIVEHFFDCQECRDHFLKIPLERSDVHTKRDVQLWLWNAHNIVNRRVGRLETDNGDGDPAFPKIQWPGAAECPECRTATSQSFLRSNVGGGRGVVAGLNDAVQREGWVLDQVVASLDSFYGRPS